MADDVAGSARPRPCWLCVYNTDEVAQKVCALIAEHVPGMSVETVAAQASLLIAEEARRKYGAGAELQGHEPADVRRHITEHMLHANVTLACTLRQLLELAEQLRRQIHTVDEETGQRVIDAAQMKNYLALTNQIAAIYKLGDGAKLLFARRSETEARGGSAAG